MNRNKAPRKVSSVVRKYKNACDDLAELVNEQLFDGCREWYWIGDEVGGACDFEDCDVLNPVRAMFPIRAFPELIFQQALSATGFP